MKVKATVSFSGIVTMAAGEIAEIGAGEVLDDLLRAGYVRKVQPERKGTVSAGENKRNHGRGN